MKKISLILLCGIILLGICGCDKKENLSDMENGIYTAILDYANKEESQPTKVRLLKVITNDDEIYAEIDNNESKRCLLYHSEYTYFTIDDSGVQCTYGTNIKNYDSVSIEKINNKLKKHWEDLGL